MNQTTKYFIARWGILFLCGFALGTMMGFYALPLCMALGWFWQDILNILADGPE